MTWHDRPYPSHFFLEVVVVSFLNFLYLMVCFLKYVLGLRPQNLKWYDELRKQSQKWEYSNVVSMTSFSFKEHLRCYMNSAVSMIAYWKSWLNSWCQSIHVKCWAHQANVILSYLRQFTSLHKLGSYKEKKGRALLTSVKCLFFSTHVRC